MDLSGAMPTSAWVEIRDASDRLLARIPARIDGGRISAELPTFASGTVGSIQLWTNEDGPVDPGDRELKELPTESTVWMVQLG